MNIIKTFSITVLVLSVCSAQNVNISGLVTNDLGVKIVGATVKLEKANISTITDTAGKFTLTDIPTFLVHNGNQLQTREYATIINGRLCINTKSALVIEIVILDLNGRAMSASRQFIAPGITSMALPKLGTGVHLYKIKAGNSEFVLKSHSIDGISQGTTETLQSLSLNAFSKKANSTAAFDDVIAVTMVGYLNFRMATRQSEESNIKMSLIASSGTVTDIDGNVYQTVRIGSQVWTVENLRTTKYNNNTPITLDTSTTAWGTDTIAKYCYNRNTTNADSINKYGALYNWYVVNPANANKVAPIGWHVPTDVEWTTLENYLISNGYNWDGTLTGNKIGKALSAMTDWPVSTAVGSIGYDLRKNNRSGFAALPGSCRFSDGRFENHGDYGSWWSSSTGGGYGNVFFRTIIGSVANFSQVSNTKNMGYSVRLVKD